MKSATSKKKNSILTLLELEHLTGSSDRDLALKKFLARTSKGVDCWEWTGTKNSKGYGKFNFKRGLSPQYAHRLSYVLFIGPFAIELDIDHTCRNTSCVNPQHLETVTKTENNRRSLEARRLGSFNPECPNGHAYTESTTYIDPRGIRQCRECRKKAAQKCRNKKKKQR